jgi:hypothetical protein
MTPEKNDASIQRARQARRVAIVIVATMVIWMGAQLIGAREDVAVRWMLLFDLAALGAFVWALIVTFWIWRSRQADED